MILKCIVYLMLIVTVPVLSDSFLLKLQEGKYPFSGQNQCMEIESWKFIICH